MASSILVHLGNPKSYSTSIQQCASSYEHSEQLVYSGFRPNPDPQFWYKSEVESKLLNNGLRYQSRYYFQQQLNQYQGYIAEQVSKAQHKGVDFLLSSENLSMRGIPNEIDVYDKLQRLELLLPQPKTYVVVFRNIKSAIYSMYKEYVNHGYDGRFNDFLVETFLLRETNYLDALLPHHVWSILKAAVGENAKIKFIFTDNKPLENLFTTIVPSIVDDNITPYANEGWSMACAESIAQQHKQQSIGVTMGGMTELHRIFWHRLESDQSLWLKRRKIRKNIKLGTDVVSNSLISETFDTSFFESDLYQFLISEYQNSLELLASMANEVEFIGEYESLWSSINIIKHSKV